MIDHKKQRIQVRPQGESAWLTSDDWPDIYNTIDALGLDVDRGDVYEFRLLMMTDAEVEALGEFDGW